MGPQGISDGTRWLLHMVGAGSMDIYTEESKMDLDPTPDI